MRFDIFLNLEKPPTQCIDTNYKLKTMKYKANESCNTAWSNFPEI